MPGRIWKAEESLISPAPSFAYIPALDGLRAVSIALVMLSHFGFGAFVPGIFGVTIFFFVSGFLITRQLLCEVGATGSLRLDMFYLRRVLRLYPALIAMVAVSAIVFPALGGRMATIDVVWALFYGGRVRGCHALYRKRTRQGHAAAFDHAAFRRRVSRCARRACLPPPSRRECGQAGRRRRCLA